MNTVLKIGLLFSLTGTTSLVEKGQYKAALLAIEEINSYYENFSILPVIEDIQSDPKAAAEKARKLIEVDGIEVLVGCYTSACRKAVLPVLEHSGGILIYPALYEGRECHPQVFYCGPVPNQQVECVLSWSIENLGSRFFLIGSDYIYPHSTNDYVKKWLKKAGGEVVGEYYFPLGYMDFQNELKSSKKLFSSSSLIVVFSTLVGKSVPIFYQQYKNEDLSCPIVSPITSEREIAIMGAENAEGHYCTSSYFETINSTKNKHFIENYYKQFGREPICGVMEGAYIAVHLLALGFERLMRASKSNLKLKEALKDLSFDAPQGKVIMDPQTQHLCLWSRIGRINSQGIIEVIWTSPGPVPPISAEGYEATVNNSATGHSLKEINCKGRGFSAIIGEEEALKESVRLAQIAAATSSSVLITGESGTGKELFAKAIHEESPRKNYPYVPVDCAAIPPNLIASELFGYEEGSFTGALKGGKRGKFELAAGGTLFLDEIGEMPVDLQSCLLRTLETKEIYRVGGSRPIPINVRVIAATNSDLIQEIAYKGSFRSDLFYRLNVFWIELPPLREIRNDIIILAKHFLQILNASHGASKYFDSATLEILKNHSWPGNIREIMNVVERSFFVASKSSVILPEHLPEKLLFILDLYLYSKTDNTLNAPQISTSLEDNERDAIITAIRFSGNNFSKAARALGISRTTLYRKIKKFDIL